MKRHALLAAPLAAALICLSASPPTAGAQTAVTPPTVAQDSFTRQASGGWGAADSGGTWSVMQGPASAFSVDGAKGVLPTPSGYANVRAVHLDGSSGRDVDVRAKMTFSPVQGAGGYIYSSLLLRRQATGAYQRIGLWGFSDGRLLTHSQTHAGEELAPDVDTGIPFTAGTYHVRVQLQGASPTTLRLRVWREGDAEPTTWLQEAKTTKGPQVAGTVGLRTSALNVTSPVTVGLDDLRVSDVTPIRSNMSNWRLVFSDDFNGTSLDTTHWSAFNGPGHGGNGLRRPAQVTTKDGNLVITAEMLNGVLNSGGIAHRASYTYGRFEFRVRTEADPTGATSGVGLTWPQNGGWPLTGENDIYETGTEPSRSSFYTFVHYAATNEQYFFQHALPATQWHDMAMEWSPTSIRIFRNDELVWTVTDVDAIPDVAHRLGFQLDAAKPAMGAPVRMYVDHARVYQG
jgi:hypothetical protein